MEQILSEFKTFQTNLTGRLDKVDEHNQKFQRRLDSVEQELARPSYGGAAEAKGITDLLIEHADFTEFKARGKGRAGLMLGRSFFPGELKTTITSTAVGSSTPGILTPERVAGIVKPGVQAFRVRDLIPRYSTGSNAVEWVKENVFSNAASPVAETISKPESALTFTIDSAPVRVLAHTIPASRQVIDDFAQLRGYLDVRLIEGLRDIEDYELVGGDGTGQHLSGLTTEATAYDTARNVSGDTYIDKLNHAISQIEDAKLRATGFILNPRDWRTIQLTKDAANNVGNYVMGGPKGDAQPMLWGLPVATTTAVPVGQFIAGDFSKCALFDRMDARVELSTEHSDFFVRNLVMLLCEERVAFCVFRSDAFVFGAL